MAMEGRGPKRAAKKVGKIGGKVVPPVATFGRNSVRGVIKRNGGTY